MTASIPCRAQTPGEKRAVIERLYAAWLAAPDLRLGQLIDLGAEKASLFYIEDQPFAEHMEKFAAHHGRNPR